MRILFITPTSIDQAFGSSMRSRYMRDALMQVGEVHTVLYQGSRLEHRDPEWGAGMIRHAFYSRRGVSPAALRQLADIRDWISELIQRHKYDVIVVRYLSTASVVPWHALRLVIADADDVIKTSSPERKTPKTQRAVLFARNFLTSVMARWVGHLWYVNPLDGPRLPGRSKSLLRNVIAFPDDARPRPTATQGRIVMVGLMSHGPNQHGLRWFVTQVLPALRERVPGMELHVIGSHEPAFAAEFSSNHVKVRGFVPHLTAEYDKAALVIAPIFFGGGTQIKIIDALAHRRPLVASTFAHAGFANDLHHRQHLLVPETREEWIDNCSAALLDPAATEQMAAAGHHAAALYDSRNMVTPIRDSIHTLVSRQ